MKTQSRLKSLNKINNACSTLPITVFPREIIFQDVQSHSCYQITLYIRNDSKQIQKLRIIQPISKVFQIKTDQNFTKSIAPGLTIKLNVYFMTEKIIQENIFEDQISICGKTFKEIVKIKAYPPREKIVIPSLWNVGRLIVNRENTVLIPLKNEGKRYGKIKCETQSSLVNIISSELKIEAQESKNLQIRLKSKKIGKFEQNIKFTNGMVCNLKGLFVQQCIQILNDEGEKLNIIDLGQVFIGQKIKKSFFILNNSQNDINCIFKSFNKNIETNDLKMDEQRGNFIIKSLPQQYARQLKNCYTSLQYDRCKIDKFEQFENRLIINRIPDQKQQKIFQKYALGNIMRDNIQQPIIQSIIIKILNNKNYIKIPIKFISVYPRIKINTSIIQYGQIKQRIDNIKQINIQNQGQRDLQLSFQNSQNIKIQTNNILKSRSNQIIKFILRAVKPANIQQIVKIKFFQGLTLEIKIFATCKPASIRAKKFITLNSSRQINKGSCSYQTLNSCNKLQNKYDSQLFNKTDVLGDLRTARLNKIFRQHIENQNQPILTQPNFNFRFDSLDNKPKSNIQKRKAKLLMGKSNKVPLKQLMKYARPLNIDEISKIIIKESEISFGNIFINTQLQKDIKIINNNKQPILFEWDFGSNECLKGTNCQMTKIQGQSQKIFKIIFNPNSLGAISLPLQYIINRNHIFQISLTAYVTLINVQISTKHLEYSFASLQNTFEKSQLLELTNSSQSMIKCQMKFQQNKHFYVQNQYITILPKSQQKLKVIYRPCEGQQLGTERTDIDKLMVKVVGGAENTIKCTGVINDAKVIVKETEIIYNNYLISTPLVGKLNIKNSSKIQTIIKIQSSKQIIQFITFDKQLILLNGQQKKQISYTILCHQQKKINGYILIHIRGSKVIKIPVETNFIFPEIYCSREIIDFGNIPIMGSNYQQTITIINLYKSEIKLQFSKKFQNQDYSIEIREISKSKTQQSFLDLDIKSKKKSSNFKEQTKRTGQLSNSKIFKLTPNAEAYFDVKFIPKKLQQFDIPIPLKLSGTSVCLVQPLKVRLFCCAIEPVVYLQPHSIAFDTRIIGEGKSCFMRKFQLRNPHEFDIDWSIQPQQAQKIECFYLSQDKGRLKAKQIAHIQVMFKPQQEGHFFQKMDVILKQKKISHISLQLQGSAILPSIKFNCNELLMPVVPLGVQSKASIILQNHGYDAITISKWKTATNFQFIEINVNFVEGKLLSLAKKHLKVQVSVKSNSSISFTTFLQFYDEFGTKYDVPISCTVDNSLMTAYPFVQSQKTIIYLEKKDNTVKINNKILNNYQKQQSVSASKLVSCQFIKNWLNYEINLSIKKFPDCLIQSEGELFYRMINRISGLDIIKRFENNNQIFYNGIYNYYLQCIRILKIEGAFLNQIRPQFLLSYKDYRLYLYSKNFIVQNQSNYQIISVNSWIILFYQLIKLYIQPQINQKIINKLIGNINISSINSIIYSNTQILVFKFFNAFNNQQPFYDFGDQIKFFQVFQKSFQKILGINFTNSLMSLKISSVVMAPTLYMVLISKFLFQRLKQYGLCQFLTENDLFSLGPKQLMLTMISFIGMLYHYSCTMNVCFEASIGDKITKTIQIENPVNRKAKYRLKILGSEQFQLENDEISLPNKGKNQLKISYHCKQNKSEEAKLLLIPQKQDNFSSIAQPMSFKLTTSILSKITLKKLQISAHLYEITNIILQVDLPMDIIDLCQFTVTLNESQQGLKSFYCFGQMNRILRNNHDKIQLKLIPLTLQQKFCRVCYRSSVFGQFNFEITAKIQTSPNIRQIKLKQLKVNKDQIVSINLPRQNQQLIDALRFLNDHHIKSEYLSSTKKTLALNKYHLSIVESSYISIIDQFTEITKNSLQGKDSIRVDLKCSFGKPFSQYACTLMLRNDSLKDIRFYRLTTSVAMKPKIIPITVKARAQQSATIKIPIKIAPCDCHIQNPIDQFSITNFNPYPKQNIDFIGIFSPDWILQKQVNMIVQNHDTLQQVIYKILLKAQQPSFFDNIKLQGSNYFKKKIRIPINGQFNEQLKIECNSKRILIEDKKIIPQRKWINVIILPSDEQDMSNIKLIKQKTGYYIWASLFISNKKLCNIININLQQKPNIINRYIIQQIILGNDYQIIMDRNNILNYEIINKNGNRYIELIFTPYKQMQINYRLYVMINGNQYQININCKSPSLPIILFPQIISYNLQQKYSSLILVNLCDNKGVYRAKIQPQQIFYIQNNEFELKSRQKRQIKIYFKPLSLQIRYKAILKFQCDNLPTYQYHLNGISQFDSCQKIIQCQIYNDRQILIDLYFTNYFSKQQQFIIDQKFQITPFQLVQPCNNIFKLQSGLSKKMIIKSNKCDKNILKQGLLQVRLGQKKWRYRLIPILIKSFTNKKYIWNCKARQIYYQNIQLPDNINLKSIQSPPQISNYLTYSLEEGTNNLKIKYHPLKPLSKQQYQIFLIADKSKYVINCIISVTQPDFDDTILIKTKEINEVGCVSFKLTNIKKITTPFKAYFMKGESDLSVQTDKNLLDAYGRPGTVIKIKFLSNVYNKRVQDELWIQTSEMLWRFKVKGILSKKIQPK